MFAASALGAARPFAPATMQEPSRATALATVAGAVFGSLLWRQHPVLGLLGGAAAAGSAAEVALGEATWQEGASRVGKHLVAATGSLALPTHPALGYVAAAVAADLLLDGEGGGVLERAHAWATGARPRPPAPPERVESRVV